MCHENYEKRKQWNADEMFEKIQHNSQKGRSRDTEVDKE